MYNATCIGGFVLLAKIDGNSLSWTYSSPLWTTTALLNPESRALDQTEAKLPAFNLFPVTRLRVGMVASGDDISSANWLDLALGGAQTSLQAAMAGDNALPTSAGRAAWKALVGPQVLHLISSEQIVAPPLVVCLLCAPALFFLTQRPSVPLPPSGVSVLCRIVLK